MKRKRSSEEYDVFLSFRESDTRLNFTDHLYRSMLRAGIRVFLDSEELEDGEEIHKVFEAVNESQIYIPIFSQNFASSSWCLREVAHMEECTLKSVRKKEIIPIFYDVNADDVKLKTDLYKDAILKHKEKWGSDELER
ncbi:TMV resistance protein N-like [Rhodamnia argentea]|uniref:ADP-ribosyl cyclase/cyclic ADP-ribose hydrolase n=1 Tax=Rhodamnia argentea TaxID=178133 RepID=A0A8B8N3D1_9MYRT|nr:TMV resistance protein N-like [Rhodamnia argentea]